MGKSARSRWGESACLARRGRSSTGCPCSKYLRTASEEPSDFWSGDDYSGGLGSGLAGGLDLKTSRLIGLELGEARPRAPSQRGGGATRAVAVRGERAERDGRRVPLSNPEDLFLCIDISLDLESDHFNFDDPFTGVEAITGLRSRTGSVVVRHEVLAARSPFSVWEAKRGGHLLPDASGLAVDLDQVSRKVYEA